MNLQRLYRTYGIFLGRGVQFLSVKLPSNGELRELRVRVSREQPRATMVEMPWLQLRGGRNVCGVFLVFFVGLGEHQALNL
jgi:hypothetical protein